MATASWSTLESTLPLGAAVHAVAEEYTLIDTSASCSHSGTALYETYIASQEESGCADFNIV